jgi:ribose transport system permease protein
VVVLLLLCLLMGLSSTRSAFYSQRNIQNVLLQTAFLSLFAIGETLVIISAGIDLSLGSLIGFAGMLVALLVTKLGVSLLAGPAILLAILLTLLVSLGIGGLQATLIHRLNLPPFVITLGALLILRSLALLLNNQLPISLADYPGLLNLANGNIAPTSPLWKALDVLAILAAVGYARFRREHLAASIGLCVLWLCLHLWARRIGFAVPIPMVTLGVIAVVTHLVLTSTRIGRYLYSVGSNEQATRLSGVNVYRVKLFAYGTSALLGGLAGILWAAYGGQGDPQTGSGYELDAVAAAVVGGANLMGGEGSVIGTLLGATLLHVILSAINLTLSSPDVWRGIVVGSVLVFAVLVTALQKRRTA